VSEAGVEEVGAEVVERLVFIPTPSFMASVEED